LLRVKQHKFIETAHLNLDDLEALSKKTYAVLYNELSNDELYMADTNRIENESRT
jgi:1-acyl-sn-glycerol-3-phosphate acyltransferase